MVRSYLKSPMHGQVNSAKDSKGNKKERKTEKYVGKQHKALDRPAFGDCGHKTIDRVSPSVFRCTSMGVERGTEV